MKGTLLLRVCDSYELCAYNLSVDTYLSLHMPNPADDIFARLQHAKDVDTGVRLLSQTLARFFAQAKQVPQAGQALFTGLRSLTSEAARVRYFRHMVRWLDTPTYAAAAAPVFNHSLGLFGVRLRIRGVIPEPLLADAGMLFSEGLQKHLIGVHDPHRAARPVILPVDFSNLPAPSLIELHRAVSARYPIGARQVTERVYGASTNEACSRSSAFGFAFLAAIPGERLEISQVAELPQTGYVKDVFRALCSQVAELNARFPGFNAEALPPLRFSEAFLTANRLIVKEAIKRFVDENRKRLATRGTVSISPGEINADMRQICQITLSGDDGGISLYVPQSGLWRATELESIWNDAIALMDSPRIIARADEGERIFAASSERTLGTLTPRKVLGQRVSVVLSESLWTHLLPTLHGLEVTSGHQAVSILPRPMVYEALELPMAFFQHYRQDIVVEIFKCAGTAGISAQRAYALLCSYSAEFAALRTSKGANWQTHGREHFTALRFLRRQGTLFRVNEALVEALELTDVEGELNSSHFRLPYPECYFDLGRAVISEDGKSRIAGLYLSAADSNDDDTDRSVIVTPVLLPGDAFERGYAIELELQLRGTEAIDFQKAVGAATAIDVLDKFQRSLVERVVSLGMKILLYVGLRNARMVAQQGQQLELTQVQASGLGTRPAGFRSPPESYEYIEIGPEKPISHASPEEPGRAVAMHWRRGHFRMQRYGPRLEQRRRVWILPVLVLSGSAVSHPKDIRNYTVV